MKIIAILFTTLLWVTPSSLYADVSSFCSEELTKKLKLYSGVIVTQNSHLYRSKASKVKANDITANFKQEVEIIEQSKAEKRYLIRFSEAENQKKHCVWISSKNLIRYNRSKPLYLSQLQEIEAYDNNWREDYNSRLFAKIMTKTADLNKNGRSSFQGVSFLNAPNGEEISTVGFFTVLYVYKKIKAQDKFFYLVSGSTTFTGQGESEYFSWISEDDVSPWPTRISLYYGKDDRKVHIWYSLSDLQNSKKTKKKPIASEPDNIEDLTPKEQVTAKFPVLVKKGIKINKSHIAYEILYYGKVSLDRTTTTSACDKDDNACISGQAVLQELDNIRVISKESKNIDIVFLVDATKSMRRYFPVIRNSIKSISKRVAQHRGRVRLGLATYGDYKSKDNPSKENMQYNQNMYLSSLTNKDFQTTFSKKINNIKLFIKDPIKDKTEAPYAAILNTVNSFEWGRTTGNKLLIWIADHGNHDGTKEFDKLGKPDLYNEKQVSDFLANNKIALVAIHVKGDAKTPEQGTVLARNFIKQAKKIVELNELPSFGPYSTTKDSDDLISTQKNLENVLEYILDLSQSLPDYLYCKTHNCKSNKTSSIQINTPSAKLYRDRYLKLHGVPKNNLKKYKNLTQIISEGFVSHERDTNDIEFWVALDPKTFNNISSSVTNLCLGLMDTSVGGAIDSMTLNLTMTYGGDPYDQKNETVSEYLERILSIPKESFDTLLDMTRSDIEKKARNPDSKFTAKLRNKVCISAKLLDMVRAGEKISPEYLSYSTKKRKVVIKGAEVIPFKWSWAAPKGIELIYIPVSFLP